MSTISFIADTPEDAAFRLEVRNWLEENLPPELKGWSTRPPPEMIRPWQRKLYDRGWIAPNWPKQYGGMEATLNQQLILQEEFGRAEAPVLSRQAVGHIGPILIHHGTEEQKAEHLPKMLSGEVLWAQGYSEPGSGSDLASLRTRGEIDGDHLVINGHKIWTTGGHYADWMYALIRTDPDAPRKQLGISMVLIDLRTPGITIRPIRTLADDEEFAEEFFDNVRVPLTNVVGKLNDGWRVAKALLDSERLGNANPQLALDMLERVRKVARATGAFDDPVFQDRLTQAELDVLAQSAVFGHAVQIARAGQGDRRGLVLHQDRLHRHRAAHRRPPAGRCRRARRRRRPAGDAGRSGGRIGAVARGPAHLHLRRHQRDPAQRHRQAGVGAAVGGRRFSRDPPTPGRGQACAAMTIPGLESQHARATGCSTLHPRVGAPGRGRDPREGAPHESVPPPVRRPAHRPR